ncbi:MAG: hypothetical protein ACYDCN_02735 [Bacteroidia bacterium]
MAKKAKAINFPTANAKFNTAIIQLMGHLAVPDATSSAPTINTWIRLGIDATTVYNVLLALFCTTTTPNTWLFVHPLAANKATRTGTLTGQQKTIKKKMLALVHGQRLVEKNIEKVAPGTLTEMDKQCFFIPEANPRTSSANTLRLAHPIPVLSISHIAYLLHIIDFRDPAEPESKGLPQGCILLQIKRYIGTVAPTDPSQYSDLLFSGKFRNPSTFVPANAKQSAWYIGRYIGPTGTISEWSAPVNQAIAFTL